MSRKRGKLSTEEEEFIQLHIGSLEPKQIAIQLNRTEETIKKYADGKNLTYRGMTEEDFDDTLLSEKLTLRPYWGEVQNQFTETELDYFRITWIKVMKQFREDVLYTEELQIKQWITLEILSNRCMRDRKQSIEQTERFEVQLAKAYAVDITERDHAAIAALETELSMVRNSIGSYTTEHTKILDKVDKITHQLKAQRTDRIKKVEDSKSSWAGFIRAIEDEEMRERIGEDAEIARIAKDAARDRLSQYHQYEDGVVDQPLLNYKTIKDE